MKQFGTFLTVALILASPRLVAAAPPIGEKAPPITVSKWMNRQPPALPGKEPAADKSDKTAGKVDAKEGDKDIAQDGRKYVFVVEFWATWCGPCWKSIPHLAELHRKYEKDGLIIIGVSNEEPETIAEFMKSKKAGKSIDMPYFVAADDENAATDAWMEDIEGIPHAFVVNREGIVVWQGNPLDTAKLDSTIEQVLAGKFDIEAAKKEAAIDKQYQKLMADLQAAFIARKEDAIFKLLDEMISLKPAELHAYMIKRMMLVEFEKSDKLADWNAKIWDAFKDDPEALRDIVEIELDRQIADREPALLIRSMVKAWELTKEPDAELLAQLARVQCESGLLDAAIDSQTKAVAAAPEDQRESHGKALAYYKGLKDLAGTLRVKLPSGAKAE